MPTPLTLLILFHSSTVFSWNASGIIVEEVPTTTGPPYIRRYPMSDYNWNMWNPVRPYLKEHMKPTVDIVDMRKMMGRWFVGIAESRYHKHLGRGRSKCIIYEFDRLILSQNTTSFDVTISSKGNIIDQKEFGYMRSFEPENARMKYYTSKRGFESGANFWIFKLGPEGRDSFGRLQYEYALIGPHFGTELVLVRNPQTFKENYKEEILNWMDANGHGINPEYPFIQPAYADCYVDSIIETVGASDERSHDDPLTIRPSLHRKTESNNSCDPNNVTLAEQFDTRKMMGRWFEGLTSHPTKNQTCIVLEYQRLQFVGENFTLDGHYSISFRVQRTYREAGFLMRKDNPTTVWSNDQEVPKFGSQLWVNKVGPEGEDFSGRIQYEYVIVSNCEKSFVLVLTRNPYMLNEIYKKSVVIWLEENGFNIGEENGIFQPDYTICHYADSITEKN